MNKVEAHLMAAGGDPYKAARVSLFMADDTPRISPSENWKLVSFSISEEKARVDEFKAALSAARREGVGAERWVPEGHYVSLQQKRDFSQAFHEGFDPDDFDAMTPGERLLRMMLSDYITMMSDTPNEIEDHTDVIEHAGGRVLVHGLGLGCIIAALHVLPQVEHIDVVEYDPEVIALTGSYYATLPKVNIVQGNALTYRWPKGAHWDYVWHDIWAKLSADNLDPSEAENGISYGILFDAFADRADRQAAWGFEQACAMEEVHKHQDAEAEELRALWPGLTPEEREDFLINAKFNTPGLIRREPDDWRLSIAAMEATHPDAASGFKTIMEEVKKMAREKTEIEEVEALLILGYASLDDIT